MPSRFLQPSKFSGSFQHERDVSGVPRFCDFHPPRARAVFKYAVRNNDLTILHDYFQQRERLPRCKGGGTPVGAEDNFRWYQPTHPNFAGKMGACGACYEDYVVPSKYVSHFATTPIRQPAGSLFTCDMAWPFFRKMMEGDGQVEDIFAWALYRRQLPACAGQAAVPGSSRKWHRPRSHDLASIWACEACYYDTIFGDVAGPHFDASPSELPDTSRVTCFVMGTVSLALVLDEAMHKQDWGIFHGAARIYASSPRCGTDGIGCNTWYSLNPAAGSFNICHPCYVSVFEARGAGHFVKAKRGTPSLPCNANLGTPHALALFRRLEQAIDKSSALWFSDFARTISTVPPCPGQDPVTGRRWRTHRMFSCCPACWIDGDIGSTSLSDCFSDEQDITAPLKCDFYSPRIADGKTHDCKLGTTRAR